MDLKDFALYKLNAESIVKPFDCGDEDLNSFLHEKAVFFSTELLATTYVVEKEGDIIAFFSIFNDSIRVEESFFPSPSAFKKFMKIVSFPKRHLRNLPALKIGRLAVSSTFKGAGLGKLIISYILDLAIRQNDNCACKFISVDAYDQSLGFYEKMGFSFFTKKDEGKDTRQMYYDLTPIINAQKDFAEIEGI